MIAYVFFKESKMISCKIDNVESISEVDKEIKGENGLVKYGDSQDFIILESDTINLNNGDTINLDNLTDCRNYFLKGSDYWYQEQIKKTNSKNDDLQTNINNQNELVNSLIEMVIATTLPTT